MADVTLLDGPFLHAQRRTEAYLLSLDPDRLLHGFRANAGLAPRAPLYGGWESAPLWADIHCQGHTLGHYLSACALMTASTADPRFRARVDHVVAELAACQDAGGTGLVCAFPEGPGLVAGFIAGRPTTGVPWYTLHKVYAGLRDAHLVAGNAQARAVLLRMADWAVVATGALSDAEFEAMLETEHGGMNEVMADCYALSGNADHAALARRFSHKALLEPLAKGRDPLDGLHANTQIPKVVGFERVHRATGDERYGHAADFFWRTVARTRSYATGGHGDGEHFFPLADVDAHVFSAKGSETCGTHNMLKLTRALFLREPRAELADFHERALWNGILASQDPDSGMVTYFQGARPGYMKLYSTAADSFWCCVGTGMENHAKYRDSLYFHDADALWVNLFVPSAVRWRDKRATLTQQTRFPEEPVTRLRWTAERPFAATLKLRHPSWSRSAVARVNGTVAARSDGPGSFVEIARTWADGDRIEWALDMAVRAEPLPGAPDIVAFRYGPVVLAAALGREGLAEGADIVVNERLYGEYNNEAFAAPTLSGSGEALAGRFRPAGPPLTFTLDAGAGPLRFEPYQRIAHQRYATYWRLA